MYKEIDKSRYCKKLLVDCGGNTGWLKKIDITWDVFEKSMCFYDIITRLIFVPITFFFRYGNAIHWKRKGV